MINRLSIRYGLVLGAISVALSLLFYVFEMNMILMGILGILVWIVSLVLWIVFAIRVRKANGGLFTFGQAFTSLAIIGTVSAIITSAWNFLLTQVIDKEYMNKMIERTVDGMVSMGMSADDPQVEEVVRQMEEGMHLSKQAQQLLIWILVMLVLSVIIAAIIKRSKSSIDALDAQ